MEMRQKLTGGRDAVITDTPGKGQYEREVWKKQTGEEDGVQAASRHRSHLTLSDRSVMGLTYTLMHFVVAIFKEETGSISFTMKFY